jgi:hypothetical protein
MYLRLIIIILIALPSAGKGQIILDTMYFNQNWEQSSEQDANYYRIVSTDTSSGSFRFFVKDYYQLLPYCLYRYLLRKFSFFCEGLLSLRTGPDDRYL